MEIVEIELSKLVSDKENPREDLGEIEELADSLQKNGQIDPCKVEDLKNGKFFITDGHRRCGAFSILKKRTGKDQKVKCIVENKMTDAERLLKRCVIDAQSKNLKLSERDRAWAKLWNLKKKEINEKQFAKLLGCSENCVQDFFDRQGLDPSIKKLLDKDEIGSDILTQTKTLDKDLRKEIIKRAVDEGISNRGVRRIAEAIRGQSKSVQQATAKGELSVEQAEQLRGLKEDKQKVAIQGIKTNQAQIKKIPKLVKDTTIKPKDDTERKKINAQQFVTKLSEEVAKTASQLRVIEGVLEQIEEDGLDKFFTPQMKKALVGFLEELDEDVEPAIKTIKKTVQRWS